MSIIPDTYDELLKEAKEKFKFIPKEYIPRLCYALKAEDKNHSKHDIVERIRKDLVDVWSRTTIYEYIPDEFKDELKQDAGKQSHKNVGEESAKAPDQKLEEPIAINTSGSSTNQPTESPPPTQTNNNPPIEYALSPEEEMLLDQSITVQQEAKVSPPNEPVKFEELIKPVLDENKTLKEKVKVLEAEKENVVKVKNEVLQKAKPFTYRKDIPLVLDQDPFDQNVELNRTQAIWIAAMIRKFVVDHPKVDYFLIQSGGKGSVRINIAKPDFVIQPTH